jgi:hypothetical protein
MELDIFLLIQKTTVQEASINTYKAGDFIPFSHVSVNTLRFSETTRLVLFCFPIHYFI